MATPNGSVLLGLCATALRLPVAYDTNSPDGFVWEPPLSTAEQATLDDLRLLASFGVSASITLAEFQAIKPDLATAKTFLGIASPTAAQSNAALKATIRVVGALLRS